MLQQLQTLIDEASALRDTLRKDGPGTLRADSSKRVEAMRRSLKSVEAEIKRK